ncbi:hypothetical protein FRB90_007032 [Tulasnella sp. 427]|nr:hypothetical protein FRB90_007032 [Tulasnella sp. 427]
MAPSQQLLETSVEELMQTNNVLEDLSISDVIHFIIITSLFKNEIEQHRQSTDQGSSHPPQFLSETMTLVLAQVLETSVAHITRYWSAFKEVVWDDSSTEEIAPVNSDLIKSYGIKHQFSRDVKLYRQDEANRFVSLGRGDVVTDPQKSATTIGLHQLMDKVRLQPTLLYEGTQALSGLKIFIEHSPSQPHSAPPPNPISSDAPALLQHLGILTPPGSTQSDRTPPLDTLPANDQLSEEDHVSSQGGFGVHADTETQIEEGPEKDVMISWLQAAFKLNRNNLPGHQRCRCARDSLELHVLVSEAKERIEDRRYGQVLSRKEKNPGQPQHRTRFAIVTEPPSVPASIAGQRIRHEEMIEAFGFSHTRWYSIHQPWIQVTNSRAKTPQSWMYDPDAKEPTSGGSTYEALNRMPMTKLPSAIIEDEESEEEE